MSDFILPKPGEWDGEARPLFLAPMSGVTDLPYRLLSKECGADFNIEHDMGIRYIPQYCTFCGAECYKEDERLDYEELDSENSDNIH